MQHELPFWFSPFGPDERAESDGLDQVMVEAAQARSAQIAGVWRTWRFVLDGSGEPGARDKSREYRVYIVQVPDGAIAPTLAGELRAALTGRGEADVEVVPLDAVPGPYQAAALNGSALLWSPQDGGTPAGGETPAFKIARVFDFAKPDTGPGFHPGHRVVTDAAERDRLLQYLSSGTPVLHTAALAPDVLDPGAGQIVPASFRTDGEWIWTDAVAYYLRRHGLAPDEDLITHIDARQPAGQVAPDTALAAANFLLNPPPEHTRKAAWTPGAGG